MTLFTYTVLPFFSLRHVHRFLLCIREAKVCLFVRSGRLLKTNTIPFVFCSRGLWIRFTMVQNTLENKYIIYRGYYTVARRYRFYLRVMKTKFLRMSGFYRRVKYCFHHEKIKFISSRQCVIFFLLNRVNRLWALYSLYAYTR